MPDAARPSCPPALRLGGAALVAALVTAGAVVALPQSASAAPAFSKTLLYATTSDGSGVVSIDRATGATSSVVPVPSGAGAINQLGLSADGGTLVLTDPTNVYEWNAGTEKFRTTPRTSGVTNNMGGIDPKSGKYYYGGVVTGSATEFKFTSYDPATHTNSGTIVTVTAEGSDGTNGDLAFDGQGNMYFIKSSGSSAQIYRVDAADLVGVGTARASKVGPAIATGIALNSMAFGDDSYLYIAGSGANAFLKVNPITGRVIGTQNLSAKVTDMASNALPTTGSVTATRPATTFDPGDDFTVTIGGNGVTTNNSATTTAKEPTATAGPVLLLPGQTDPYTIAQTPAGTTNPVNYTTTWLCKDPATGKAVIDGTGTTGTFTIPAGVASVDCSFTNAVKPKPVATTDEAAVSEPGKAVTVDVVKNDAGDLDPATLSITGADGKPTTALHVEGQGDWTVDTTKGTVTFTPAAGFTGDPAPVDYTVRDGRGLETGAQVVVTYQPTAAADTVSAVRQGSPAVVDVTANDSDNVDPTSVQLLDADGTPRSSLTVGGQGTWTVDPKTGRVTFTTARDFTGNPTPVTYRVATGSGATTPATATITVRYAVAATADDARDNTVGSTVTVDVTANDSANVDRTTVQLLDADGTPVSTLPIADQGTWTVDATTGAVTFTPLPGFTGNPAPVTYTVSDGSGHTSSAPVQVAYRPVAAADAVVAPTPGEPVSVPVLANDSAGLERTSVHLVDGAGDATRELVVDGEGTWTVDAATGVVTFTPQRGFTGNPAPVTYTAGDAFERGVRQTVTVSYLPVAAADGSTGNTVGSPASVTVTTNDSSNVVASSVRLVQGAALVTELPVAGQGTWTVDTATGTVTFTPAAGYTGDPTPVRYSVQDAAGHATTAVVTVAYAPVATKDVSRRNALGSAVTVDVVGNDSANVDRSTLRLLDADGQPVTTRTVRGEGTWTADTSAGTVTFTPETGFTGDPTTARYTVQDGRGETTTADVDVTYQPAAVDDVSGGNALGEPVTVDVAANDSANVDPASVRLLDRDRNPQTTFVVDGEGTWTVDTASGELTFTPLDGFTGNPTPVRYSATGADGATTTALVSVRYLPLAADDSSLDHATGETVSVDVTANDSRNVDPTTVRLLAADGTPVTSLAVEGEGTWTVDTTTGRDTFVPEADFTGNPSTVEYTVSDASGEATSATVSIAYAEADPTASTPVAPAPTATGAPAPTAPTTTPEAAPRGGLAFTGADLLWPGLGGLAMLLAGGVLLLTRRRRGGRHV
ncbi:tandem-95 repeat protein [Curtobacterium sp. MCBA15_008]|uniref:Ig-like domain-containing protein n=1 Tax=Curtobacterium sp. MCBA15_008 TaxID=1898736 RepID=UPI0008DC820C|nr:tandem-95 repeat protein [Curtobacterium sp. MCBA15_008]OII13739.1 hypothetical protein BIU96_13325 [Curtobacterium sp. MCBA15_008]